MPDPYTPPSANVANPETESKWPSILARLSLLLSMAIAGVIGLVVPSFQGLFESLEAPLTGLALWSIKYHNALWMVPLFGIGMWLIWPGGQRGRLVAMLSGPLAMVLGLVVWFSLYLPIVEVVD